MPTEDSSNLLDLRLTEAVRLCKACALGTQGSGVPGRFIGEQWPESRLSEFGEGLVMILGEAPGAVEQAQGKPFVGRSGELLHSLLQEAGLTSYYVSNIAKHQPFKDQHGKQQAPDKVASRRVLPFSELSLSW